MSKYITKQRKILLDYLCGHADETLSARQIADDMAKDDISISAVYRNLAELEDEGKVTRLSKGGSRKVYFRYTAAEECKLHLHLSCSKCGKTYHMGTGLTNMLISSVAKDTNFMVDCSNTILYGICEACLSH